VTTAHYDYSYTAFGPKTVVTKPAYLDGTQSTTVSITTQLDWAGNALWTTDPVTGLAATCNTYDAYNRVIASQVEASIPSSPKELRVTK
jgi:hypothetical protein